MMHDDRSSGLLRDQLKGPAESQGANEEAWSKQN